MPRTLSTAVATAVASAQVSPVLFAEIAFADQTLYLFGGIGTLTPAGPPSNAASTFPYGQAFTGLGWLAKLSSIPQTTKIQAQNITLALSGIPAALVSEAINQVRMTGTAAIFLGFFDTTGALIKDPIQIFAGGLDVPTLSDGGDTCTLSITCENPLLALNLAPNRRFDDADQQVYSPGDLGFSFVDALANLDIYWPSPNALSSPYPVQMVISPNGADIAVGGTTSYSVTITYSDTSTYSLPSHSGSGPAFVAELASSNPRIATISNTTGIATGVSPGECSIMVRVPTGISGSGWGQQMRAACSLIVHS